MSNTLRRRFKNDRPGQALGAVFRVSHQVVYEIPIGSIFLQPLSEVRTQLLGILCRFSREQDDREIRFLVLKVIGLIYRRAKNEIIAVVYEPGCEPATHEQIVLQQVE